MENNEGVRQEMDSGCCYL